MSWLAGSLLPLLRVGQPRSRTGRMSLAAVLDAATDDTLLAIAIALPTPADLLRLALTCRAAAQRFHARVLLLDGEGGWELREDGEVVSAGSERSSSE